MLQGRIKQTISIILSLSMLLGVPAMAAEVQKKTPAISLRAECPVRDMECPDKIRGCKTRLIWALKLLQA